MGVREGPPTGGRQSNANNVDELCLPRTGWFSETKTSQALTEGANGCALAGVLALQRGTDRGEEQLYHRQPRARVALVDGAK